jgi:serine/threonine-protein kinase RsbW
VLDLASQTLTMSSPPDDVNRVHELLEAVWAGHTAIGFRDRISFETAVIELASNVIRHADSGQGVAWQLSIDVGENRLEASLTDSGEPKNIALEGRELPDELAESGRGIPLIKALVDVVEYEHEGGVNRWRISRTLTP